MPNLGILWSSKLDPMALICYLNTALMQVVEIPRGSKVKYELDKKTGLIKVYYRLIC